MLAKALVATTVPDLRGRVNIPSIENAQSRAAARVAVAYDTRLTGNAVRLYIILDDHAGYKAECWPHQGPTERNPEGGLSQRIRKSVRSVKRWIAELVAAGYITIRRTQNGNRYLLSWLAVPENNVSAKFGPSEVPAPSRAYSEPFKEPEGLHINILDATYTDEREFGIDDAVALFNWAAAQPDE